MLQKIEAIATDEFSIAHTLTQALLKAKCYKQLWSYWKKKWENDGDNMDHIYYIEQIFINKLEEGALFRQLHPSACFFILKHNYGYNTRGHEELPSHLLADLEHQQTETPRPGSKTTAPPQEKPATPVKTSIIHPPATGFIAINKDIYNTGLRQSDKLITADPHNNRTTKTQLR
ncbi:MAG: hypothetical protein JST83_11065 [Bacteroidetes bacterium]|nr:hypothetical protein [Bacteroidota bacterium]